MRGVAGAQIRDISQVAYPVFLRAAAWVQAHQGAEPGEEILDQRRAGALAQIGRENRASFLCRERHDDLNKASLKGFEKKDASVKKIGQAQRRAARAGRDVDRRALL